MEYLFLLTCIALSFGTCWGAADWEYSGEYGPDKWYESYPTCGQSRQSPVNVVADQTQYDGTMGDLIFTGLDTVPMNTNFTLLNNGHTIQITLENASLAGGFSNDITVRGGGLPATANLFQFHLHWGSTNYNGSEHVLNSNPNSAEMHFVFINQAFTTAADALADDEGLEVVGVFIEVGAANNDAFDVFLDNYDAINKGNSTRIDPFAVGSLFPANKDEFYRYLGSLTTPPCSEAVVWTVLNNGIQIAQAQMDKLRQYVSADDHKLSNNARPTQPLNERVVIRSFDPDDEPSGQTRVLSVSMVWLLLTSVLVMLTK